MITRRGLTTVLALLGTLVPVLAEAGGSPRRGPLRVRSQFQLDLPTLDLTPEDARLHEPRTGSVELLVVHSSTFQVTADYDARVMAFEGGMHSPDWDFYVDGEVTRLSVRADWGVGRRVQLGIEVPVVAHSAGFMDSFVDEFHEITGLPGNGRETRPRDQFAIDLISSGDRLGTFDAETAVGDVVIRGKFALHDGLRWAASTMVEVKAPTGDEDAVTGSGEVDFGLSFLLSGGGPRHFFHGGAGHQFLGQPESYPVKIRDRTSVYLGWEMRASPRWSIPIQLLASTSLLPEMAGRSEDDPRLEIAAGAHYGTEDWQFSFGFTENLTTNDNATDVGIFFGGRWWH